MGIGTDMFVANFTLGRRVKSKNLGIKVSLLDFLIYNISPEIFMERFNKRLTNDAMVNGGRGSGVASNIAKKLFHHFSNSNK